MSRPVPAQKAATRTPPPLPRSAPPPRSSPKMDNSGSGEIRIMRLDGTSPICTIGVRGGPLQFRQMLQELLDQLVYVRVASDIIRPGGDAVVVEGAIRDRVVAELVSFTKQVVRDSVNVAPSVHIDSRQTNNLMKVLENIGRDYERAGASIKATGNGVRAVSADIAHLFHSPGGYSVVAVSGVVVVVLAAYLVYRYRTSG